MINIDYLKEWKHIWWDKWLFFIDLVVGMMKVRRMMGMKIDMRDKEWMRG